MLNKEVFVKMLDALERQDVNDRLFAEKLTNLFKIEDGFVPVYNNGILVTTILGYLGNHYDLEELHRYCYELDFGKAEGADIKTSGELWEYLNLIDNEK
jgi:hypothetical protein